MSKQQSLKILGVITARGGSKGIPRKNIKELRGKPLILYTIETAQNAGIFDRLVLSTDDPEIAFVAKQYGVEVPFIRPAQLAQDNIPHLPVLEHAVSWLKENQNYWPDAVMLLQPTAPLRRVKHVTEALDLFVKSGADSVVSVSQIPGHFSPYWAVVMDGTGLGRLFTGEPVRDRIGRRQDFPKETYFHNGAIYLFKPELLFDPGGSNFYGEKVVVYPMEAKYSINIDGSDDWFLAELALERLTSEEATIQ